MRGRKNPTPRGPPTSTSSSIPAGDGPFVGVQVGRAHATVTHDESGASTDFYVHECAVRAGYQWDITAGFYLVPWLSVGYAPDLKAVTLAGEEQNEPSKLTLFPTLHIGYRIP